MKVRQSSAGWSPPGGRKKALVMKPDLPSFIPVERAGSCTVSSDGHVWHTRTLFIKINVMKLPSCIHRAG